jgi:hypothetical protein
MTSAGGAYPDMDQAVAEFDGVAEALAERDAAMGESAHPTSLADGLAAVLEEPVATADVIAQREKKDFPRGFGQTGLVPITAMGESSPHVRCIDR